MLDLSMFRTQSRQILNGEQNNVQSMSIAKRKKATELKMLHQQNFSYRYKHGKDSSPKTGSI